MEYLINYDKPCHVHFIGIGGVSMSGLAYILMKNGFTVSGSDISAGTQTDWLQEQGMQIFIGHDAAHITPDIDVVIYNSAIHSNNPEYAKALSMGLPMLTRGQLLGQIMQRYPMSVGVSGTHGKTTTTSFLSHILIDAGVDPTSSVGGVLKKLGGTIRLGNGPVFLTEACEYTNNFLSLYPFMEVVLNIEEDHLDFFKDITDIRNSFRIYFTHIPQNGYLVINADIQDLEELTQGLSCQLVTYSSTGTPADYQAVNICLQPNSACYEFDVRHSGSDALLLHAKLNVPGLHNVSNALAAIAAALTLDIPCETISDALSEFHGTDRRFQVKGSFQGVTVVDDYAHHPQEITATLATAQNYPHRELWCLFQPHTYSRTKALFDGFVQSLAAADHIVLAPIYSAARETDTLGMSSELLCQALKALGKDVYCPGTFEQIEEFLCQHCVNGDLLITMGAGDIKNVGEDLISKTNE